MKTFGPYEVVDVVAVTAAGSVMAARVKGRPGGRFAVKHIKSCQSEPDEPQWDSQFFLDRARIQKSVVAAGGRHWLPVHDLGSLPDGAWVATDYIPLSAQKLIDGRVRLSAAQLQHIIDGVVKALVELQQVRYRACGSLKPSNVLLAPGDLTQTAVFLTDPSQGPGPTETSDMYALGNLIHQLVVHRPFEVSKQWPLPESDEWDALGKTGQQWRELCTDLLAPQPASRPRLADVCRIVRDLAFRRRRKMPGRMLLIPAAVACVTLALLVSLYVLTSSARQQLSRVKRVWADPLALALEDHDRRLRFQNDPDLKAAVEHLDRAGLAGLATEDKWTSDLNVRELQRLRRALAQVQQVAQDLSPQHWHRLADLVALQQQFQGRGWSQPADFIGKLLRGVEPRGGVPLAGGIDRLLQIDSLIRRDKEQVEGDWRQLNTNCKQLETGDRTLWSFARALRNSASASVRLSDDGFGGIETLKTNTAVSTKLAQAVPSDWPANIDVQGLAADTLASVNLSRPTTADIERWLANLPLYSIRTTETALAAGVLQKQLKGAEQMVAKSNPTEEDRAAFDRAREQIASRIKSFATSRFIEKQIESGAFAERQSAIELEIQSLRRFARAENLAELVKNLPTLKTRSQAINEYWDSWKANLATRERPNLAVLKSQAEQMRSTLTDLDQELPAAPGDLSDSFTATALHRREALIKSLLGSIDPKSPQLDALRLASAASTHGQWCRLLQKLAQDFPIRKQLLSVEDKPDEKWLQQAGFWEDPDVQQLVQADVQRLAALRALTGAPRERLFETARAAGSAELALEAWRLLAQAPLQPTWPHDAAELAAERDLRGHLAGLIAKVQDPAERQRAESLLREQGPARWRIALEQASHEDIFATAWELRDAFGVDTAQFDGLSAAARFNLWLWRARQVMGAGDEAALQSSVDELAKAASELKTPSALALASALSRQPPKSSFLDSQTGDIVSVAFTGGQTAVQFKRVEVPDHRAFYLCTTEVSLGQFIAIVDTARAWDQCRQLPWPYLESGRRGPRVWEWTSAHLQPAQLWLGREEDNDFAPPLRAERFNRMMLSDVAGGMPSPQHPMQQLSAQTALWFAGLCGCRLPTPQEWLAAYSQFEKNVPQDRLNLRDLTWEVQRRYSSDARPALPGFWPYEDIFPAEGDASPSLASDMRTHRSNDGVLLFRPVGLSGGTVFHHLVGNVAEYLCDEPDKYEAIGASKSPQAVAEFVRQVPRSLYVIGGSALSPPNVPVDKPLPVLRPEQSYCDVGLRLAVSAPPRSLAEKVKWALRGQDYLWPPQNTDAAQLKLEH